MSGECDVATAEQALVGQPLRGDVRDVLAGRRRRSTPSLVSSSVVILAETASSRACERRLVDLGQVVVPHERGDVLGRLGVQVVLERDEPELRDRRLGRAQLGDVDGLALERLRPSGTSQAPSASRCFGG